MSVSQQRTLEAGVTAFNIRVAKRGGIGTLGGPDDGGAVGGEDSAAVEASAGAFFLGIVCRMNYFCRVCGTIAILTAPGAQRRRKT